jgi:hypothetical protein
VQMADGDGQGIGHIGRLGHGFQLEEAGDHHLHLGLFRPAIADYRGLDG